MFGEDDIVKSHKSRADAVGNIILISFVIIVARLWYLQIYKGKDLYKFSIQNSLRKEVAPAPRGMVFSRNNQLLVHNIPRFDVVVTPQYLRNKKESLTKLAEILDMDYEQIIKILAKNSYQARYQPITIKKNISRKEVAVIETENSKMPGVSVVTFISREYTDKEIGGHLLGYISEISQGQLPKYRKRDNYPYKLGDFIGQAGLEEELDLYLRGEDGYEFMEVDALGRMKRYVRSDNLFAGIKNQPAIPGNNLRLTIDRDLQLSAYKALEGKVGSAVAVDTRTGEILAMVSRPSFDPTKFSRGLTPEYWGALSSDEKNPLRDRTIQEHYAPGSTFKTFTAIAALEEGIIDERTEVKCNGSFRLGRRKFHCWKEHGHGKVDVYKALRESCDVFFYKIATQLDIDVLAKYSKMFGLGNRTGIALPRETTGLIPTKEWKEQRNGQEWQKGETLSCVIGQSFVLTTPIQLAMSYAAIANAGKLYAPKLVKEIFSNSGDVVKKSKPEIVSEVKLSKKTLDIIHKGLYAVVNDQRGTAWWYRGEGLEMAGKTGTSQVISFSAEKLFSKCEDKEYKYRHHGVFAGYAPAGDPHIAVAAVVEHGCGSKAAIPVVRDIVTTYMSKYLPEKKKNYAEKQRQAQLRRIRYEQSMREKAEKEKTVSSEADEQD